MARIGRSIKNSQNWWMNGGGRLRSLYRLAGSRKLWTLAPLIYWKPSVVMRSPAAFTPREPNSRLRAVLVLSLLTCAATAQASPRNDRGFLPFLGMRGFSPVVEGPVPIVAAKPVAKPHRKRAARHVDREVKEPSVKPPTGPLQIIISIADQQLTVYNGGVQIAQAPVSTGTPGHSTPMGVFTVIEKQRWHRSNLYSGAPMPFMQRITWSGVAMHAGLLPGYPASHGCIRMPPEFAMRLYGMTKMGARVIIARNAVTPVEISDPLLFPVKKPLTMASALPMATAQADSVATDVTPPIRAPADKPAAAPAIQAKAAPRRGAVSVFISRKEKRLFVRQSSRPVFDLPVTIHNPELPLGTHVLTATELKDDGAAYRWDSVSIPSEYPRGAAVEKPSRDKREKVVKLLPPGAPLPTATEALSRIEIPTEASARISEMLSPGFSLIISDNGVSDETGSDTDFVILTR
jgi:lipoprotein-anchoring transpeptidase ErfK/SrfK